MSPEMKAIALRPDLMKIYEIVQPGSRVLDLGAGSGDLLKTLERHKGVTVRGVEISEEGIMECIAKGVPIYQSNLDEGLADYGEQSFDYVILSQTLQQVHRPKLILQEIVRVGRIGIVSIPNFAHWHIRIQLLLRGTMPRTSYIPYHWYETPNIHLLSIRDFRKICAELGIRIRNEWAVSFRKAAMTFLMPFWPNMLAPLGIFEISRR
ncbi:MAG: methionine biosynthesis protein MetW [Candidatus Aureabacteria bacterium]|nr:methionine biosynthesis protein MetW [Candidatus Auribacterota bacterium]